MERSGMRAEHLAQFLNAPVSGVEHARVVEVFRYCQQLESLEPSSPIAANTRRAINAHLSEIHVVPVRQQNGWDWKAGHPGRVLGVSPAFALKVVSELDAGGLLGRMRQCEVCVKWFFAATAKKRVCTDACRYAKFKQSDPEAYNQDRAAYMRDYREKRSKPGVKKWRKNQAKKRRPLG
jgi:hypothetical protein